MNGTIGICFDASDRRAIEEARRSWSEQEFGPGSRMEVLPPLGGPDSAGKMTIHWLEAEFVSYLRVKGFQFDLI